MRYARRCTFLVLFVSAAVTMLLWPTLSQAMLVGIRSGGNLVVVDPTADPAIPDISEGKDLLESFNSNISSITFDPTSNKLYAVSLGGISGPPTLFSIDWETLIVKEIGSLHFPSDSGYTIHVCEGLSFNPIDNQLYATVATNLDPWVSNRLVVINPINAEVSELGVLQGLIDGDEIEFAQETLYLADVVNTITYLYDINYGTNPGYYTNTGVIRSGSCVWMAYDETDGQVYYTRDSSSAQDLWSFDATSPGDYRYETYIGIRKSLITIAAIKKLYYVDIMPGECPNNFFRRSTSGINVAIMGNWRLDVLNIDPSSIEITCSYFSGSSVRPARWFITDVGGLFAGRPGECGTPGPDGYADLVMEFNTQDLVTAGLNAATEGEKVEVTISGLLLDGTPFNGEDYIEIQQSGSVKPTKVNIGMIMLLLLN
jgi:hypothetical protein